MDDIERMKRQAMSLPHIPTPKPMNLPDGVPVPAAKSTSEPDERMTILYQTRRLIEQAAEGAGYEWIGAGFGMREDAYGEADIGLRYAGHKIEVRVYLPKEVVGVSFAERLHNFIQSVSSLETDLREGGDTAHADRLGDALRALRIVQ